MNKLNRLIPVAAVIVLGVYLVVVYHLYIYGFLTAKDLFNGALIILTTVWVIILINRMREILLVGLVLVEIGLLIDTSYRMTGMMETSGVLFWLEHSIIVIGYVMISLGLFSERTKLLHMLDLDLLTNLANRRCFRNRVDQLVKKDEPFAILMLNFDHFKLINNSYGYEFGDQVIICLANKLKDILKENTFIARIGNDEFLLVIEDYNHQNEVHAIANEIIESFKQIQILDQKEFHIPLTIGASFYPEDGKIRPDLVRKANKALRVAKKDPINRYLVFDKDEHIISYDDMHSKMKIIKGLSNMQFIMHYQPIVNLETDRVIAAEALIRCKDDSKFYPDAVIRVAEKYGLIVDVDMYILNQVCSDINNNGFEIQVSINISSITIGVEDISDKMLDVIKKYNINPNQITIEITETAFILNESNVINNLMKLHQAGFAISLDDFGTGYSSLSHLSILPINNIKIDRMFVDGIGKRKKDETLLKKMLEFSKIMGLDVVAEGIENDIQYEFLCKNNCKYAQGYKYSRPIQIQEFLHFTQLYNK